MKLQLIRTIIWGLGLIVLFQSEASAQLTKLKKPMNKEFNALLAPSSNAAGQTVPTIYYVYDALCGWCFGMSPVIKQLSQDYANKAEIRVLSGGMVLGDRVGPATDMAEYIRSAYKRVEGLSGVTFGKPYLDGTLSNPKAMFNSLKPAIALTVAKQLQPAIGVKFAHAVQHAIFVKGSLPDEWSTYQQIATDLGLDRKAFDLAILKPEAKKAAEVEFNLVKSWGISGFPCVVMAHNGQYYLLTEGFLPAKELVGRIEKVMSGQAKG